MTAKVKKGLSWLKFVVLLWVAFAIFKALFGFAAENPVRQIVEAFLVLVAGSVMTGIPAFVLGWLTGKNENNHSYSQASVVSVGPMANDMPNATPAENKTTSKPRRVVSQVVADEDRIYAEIAKELEEGVTDKGLWTRLFAESDGDEKKTKVRYIKERADRLISSERSRLEQAAHEQATLTKDQHAIQQEKREALLKDRLRKAEERIDLDEYQTLGDLAKYASRQGFSKAKGSV